MSNLALLLFSSFLFFCQHLPRSAFQIQVSVWSPQFSIGNFNFTLFLFLPLIFYKRRGHDVTSHASAPPWPAMPIDGQCYKPWLSWILIQSQLYYVPHINAIHSSQNKETIDQWYLSHQQRVEDKLWTSYS